MFSTKYEK